MPWHRELPSEDQAVYLWNVTWSEYERIAATRGESSVPRLTYFDGVLELVSPGRPHESDKTKLARLFEAYVDHLGIRAEGIGSWTVQDEDEETGAEADECYVLRKRVPADIKCPELVIEVVYHSGGLNKLEVWHALGAKEVWLWTLKNKLQIFVRKPDKFVSATRSKLVPRVDPKLLVRCMAKPDQTSAVRALRRALARK